MTNCYVLSCFENVYCTAYECIYYIVVQALGDYDA